MLPHVLGWLFGGRFDPEILRSPCIRRSRISIVCHSAESRNTDCPRESSGLDQTKEDHTLVRMAAALGTCWSFWCRRVLKCAVRVLHERPGTSGPPDPRVARRRTSPCRTRKSLTRWTDICLHIHSGTCTSPSSPSIRGCRARGRTSSGSWSLSPSSRGRPRHLDGLCRRSRRGIGSLLLMDHLRSQRGGWDRRIGRECRRKS